MSVNDFDSIRPIVWDGAALSLLDQRLLPAEERYLPIRSLKEAADAITSMVVRGAPAIGVTAAYGAVLGAKDAAEHAGEGWVEALSADLDYLAAARPTAVNLGWAVARVRALIAVDANAETAIPALVELAERIHAEDLASNRRMGELGAEVLTPAEGILTHCNAGSLATAGFGTALAVIRAGWAADQFSMVYADETRPWLQGARLTAWELVKDGIPVELLADGAAAWLMQQRRIGWVVVGADRVAGNGDVANKIGTYSLAVNARHHGVRFMVVAPTSTIDRQIGSGADIPIEVRGSEELLGLAGQPVAAPGAGAWNPVFDVTPAALVDVLVTERGVVFQPDRAGIDKLFSAD
ncbi:MAG: S-methyl-5-thioribose-1-phosphate isomerase [Pseudomonadota bacterium]